MEPDAHYKSYDEMVAAEKDNFKNVNFDNEHKDHSRTVSVDEKLPSEYNLEVVVDEISPLLHTIQQICTEKHIPFVTMFAIACDSKGDTTNLVVGYQPAVRTPIEYRIAAELIRGEKGSLSNLTSTAYIRGKASGSLEIEEAVKNIKEDDFTKEKVLQEIRSISSAFMLTSLISNGNNDVIDKLKQLFSTGKVQPDTEQDKPEDN